MKRLPRFCMAPQVRPDEKLPRCLICGKPCRSVGHHVWAAHGISAEEYRDMHGIPRSRKLTSEDTRIVFAMQAASRGLGTDHASLRSMAKAANIKSSKVISDLVASGRVWGGENALSREKLITLLRRAESGERPYQVAREMGISWSGLHGALKRHPDLHARYKALPVRRGRTKTL